MNKNFKKIGFVVSAALLAVAFNNCAQKLSTAPDPGTMLISSNSSTVSYASVAENTQGMAANDEAAKASSRSLLEQFAAMKLYTSNSANGPFVENGAICKGQIAYFKTAGVNPNLAIKGCASPTAATGCLDIIKHRTFLASEWVSGNIVTVVAAAESANYPLGDYSFYMSGVSGNTNFIQKVGTSTMKTCGTATASVARVAPVAPVAKSCQFRILVPQTVVGGGVSTYPFVCNVASNGRTGIVRYEAGESSRNSNAVCECK